MISIAMATYNGEKYLKEQIDSILNQSIQDFELVVCDDCSTDNTWSLLDEYAQHDNRITIIENEKNLGVKHNFEKAISLTKGDFIAFSDQDDIWMPNHLELLLKAIENKSMACGNAEMMYEDGSSMNMTLQYQDAFDYIPEDDLKKALTVILFRNPFQGASMLIRRELAEKAGNVPNGVGFHDEWLASFACFYGGINYIKTPILKYRRLEKSVTGLKDARRSKIHAWRYHHIYPDRIHIINALLERLEKPTDKQKELLQLLKRIYLRNNSNTGKVLNGIYKLRHYKDIYSCNINHWL